MPSKLGFGNTRKKTGKASYGSSLHYKNPIKKDDEVVKGKTYDTVEVSGGKGGKSLAQRQYEKNLNKRASELYMKDRAFRTGGTDFNKASREEQVKYLAKAQKEE